MMSAQNRKKTRVASVTAGVIFIDKRWEAA